MTHEDRLRSSQERLARRSRPGLGGCVLFTGHLDKQGYARIWHIDEKRLVHRVAYELFVGEIPEGLQIDHLCGVRHCVNPSHLEAVTPLVNTRRSLGGYYRRTHCKNGHEFTTENTRVDANKQCRICRACDAQRAREIRARRAA